MRVLRGTGSFDTAEGRTTPLLEYFLPCAMSSKLIQAFPKNQMLRSDWRDDPSAPDTSIFSTCRAAKTHLYKNLILRLKFNLYGILRVIYQFSTKINTCMP